MAQSARRDAPYTKGVGDVLTGRPRFHNPGGQRRRRAHRRPVPRRPQTRVELAEHRDQSAPDLVEPSQDRGTDPVVLVGGDGVGVGLFTPKRSLVRSQYRPPPPKAPDQPVQGPSAMFGPKRCRQMMPPVAGSVAIYGAGSRRGRGRRGRCPRRSRRGPSPGRYRPGEAAPSAEASRGPGAGPRARRTQGFTGHTPTVLVAPRSAGVCGGGGRVRVR